MPEDSKYVVVYYNVDKIQSVQTANNITVAMGLAYDWYDVNDAPPDKVEVWEVGGGRMASSDDDGFGRPEGKPCP